jgi:hypothetical protein
VQDYKNDLDVQVVQILKQAYQLQLWCVSIFMGIVMILSLMTVYFYTHAEKKNSIIVPHNQEQASLYTTFIKKHAYVVPPLLLFEAIAQNIPGDIHIDHYVVSVQHGLVTVTFQCFGYTLKNIIDGITLVQNNMSWVTVMVTNMVLMPEKNEYSAEIVMTMKALV